MNLKDFIRSIPDYPKKGILFRDITTLIKNEKAFSETINQIVERSKKVKFDKIAAIESRGFVFASAVSYILKKPFVMLRKKNKLPADVHSIDFELEYGTATIEVHKDSIDENDNVLIIDEINRGNIPKIFGELITLIEEDKRKEKHALKLAYSQKSFFVPENLLIIGTMNTADKSLMQMDDALKRRFVFEELMPDTKALRNNFRENSVSDGENYAKILEKINEKIIGKGAEDEKQKKIQFRDRQIGQSYFWNVKSDGDLQDVIKYDIIPLLQDYFYGDYDEIRNVLGEKIIGDDNRPTSLVSQRDKARNLKDELLRI